MKNDFDNFKELVKKSRSYRRFDASETVSYSQVKELIDLARLCPTSGNLQPLRFGISLDPAKNDKICESLLWGYFLPDWVGPDKAQRPPAYIIIMQDTTVRKTPTYDAGIAAQTMLLGATEMGLGGCMFASSDEKVMRSILPIPEHYQILLTVAIGKPEESVEIVDLPTERDDKPAEDAPLEDSAGHEIDLLGGASHHPDTKYYRDETGRHFVPKRSLGDLVEFVEFEE